MKIKNFLNLSNGIEALEAQALFDYSFIRIQSTLCEQKRWDQIIADLDYNFLLNLAIGNHCYVWDYSQNRKDSRALWQGIPFVLFVLNKIWLDKEIQSKVRNECNVTDYFREQYQKLNKKTINKIKYFKKFLNTEKIYLTTMGFQTKNDGKYEYYKDLLIQRNK